ncbi:MAG: hypothetical protein ABSE54_02145 [Smithella sp.]|jgi:hypothetical protein
MQNNDKVRNNLVFIEAMGDAISECDDASLGEIREELKADGVDLDESVKKLMDFVRICAMDAKRESLDVAAEARKAKTTENNGLAGKFATFTKDQLLARIKSLTTLPEGQVNLAFNFRELDGKNQEYLASILEDLEDAMTLENKKNEDRS